MEYSSGPCGLSVEQDGIGDARHSFLRRGRCPLDRTNAILVVSIPDISELVISNASVIVG